MKSTAITRETNETADGSIPAILTTKQAAAALNRKPQTLQKWASLGIGGITPVRINGRLAWRASDVRALLARNKV
jgi:hypothetical protein